MVDYTKDKNTENVMKHMIHRMIDMDYEVIAVIDISLKRVRFCKKEQEEFFNLQDKSELYNEIVIQPLSELIVSQEVDYAIKKLSIPYIVDALSHSKTYVCTYMVKEKTGKEGFRRWKFTYLDEEKNLVLYTRSNVTDLYEIEKNQRKILRNALIQAEKDSKIIVDFISQISHEIRNPMNAMIGIASQGMQPGKMKNELRECIGQMEKLAKRISESSNEILDYVMLKKGNSFLYEETFQFQELLQKVNTKYYAKAEEKDIEYLVSYDSFVEDYYIGDSEKLSRILCEIISNGIKYTPKGGKIKLTIRVKENINDTISMQFIINDTGVGISDSFLPYIFDPFQREKRKTGVEGIGLGLSICKQLVGVMNGTLHINTIQDVGTKFVIEIPLRVMEQNSNKRNSNKHLALIIHRETAKCQAMRKILESLGVQTKWVTSNTQAFRFIHRCMEQGEAFDFVFYDFLLSVNQDGSVIHKLKSCLGEEGKLILTHNEINEELEKTSRKEEIDIILDDCVNKSFLKKVLDSRNKGNFSNYQKEYDFTGKRVLIVEDHKLNVRVVRNLLEKKHAQIDVAENGLVAIEEFISNDAGYYDAVLMDIQMPLIDGITATRAIRSTKKSDSKTIPIIAMSANVYEKARKESKAAGMNAHIAKPIEPEVFYGTLYKFLLK
ncbi:MAG: response regulator [Anaerostipes sp.]|nr:response regulator [Anaerostipes sp.]